MATITIEGIKYEVVRSMTVSQMLDLGLNGSAGLCEQNKIMREIYIKRPKGKKHFLTHEYTNEMFSRPVAVFV